MTKKQAALEQKLHAMKEIVAGYENLKKHKMGDDKNLDRLIAMYSEEVQNLERDIQVEVEKNK